MLSSVKKRRGRKRQNSKRVQRDPKRQLLDAEIRRDVLMAIANPDDQQKRELLQVCRKIQRLNKKLERISRSQKAEPTPGLFSLDY